MILSLTENYREKELKDELQRQILKFLTELGKGFAFVGREYRIQIGNTEKFIDMLFYNIPLHCYVVVEIKTTTFDFPDVGQLGGYVAAVDGLLNTDRENPAIGLLICKDKDNVLAHYALKSSNVPLGISEYQLANLLPDDFRYSMPTIEEIENGLSADR